MFAFDWKFYFSVYYGCKKTCHAPWVKSTCNLNRIWKYQSWNSFLAPWYVKSFGNISGRSVKDVKVGAGDATEKTGVGVVTGVGWIFVYNIIIRISAIKAACFFFFFLSASCFYFRFSHLNGIFVQFLFGGPKYLTSQKKYGFDRWKEKKLYEGAHRPLVYRQSYFIK